MRDSVFDRSLRCEPGGWGTKGSIVADNPVGGGCLSAAEAGGWGTFAALLGGAALLGLRQR